MYCTKCNKSLIDCECPGRDEQLEQMAGNPVSGPACQVNLMRRRMKRGEPLIKEQIPASPEHEHQFRKTFRLREDLEADPMWRLAFEHAAMYKLYPEEMTAIGPALERKTGDEETRYTLPI